ncbi:hypothetical protein DFP73DRAFT_581307 [Morchella snyderi]|nr:hypothetical protein DFP73DRAFT_581307 [Morchella snyderi]
MASLSLRGSLSGGLSLPLSPLFLPALPQTDMLGGRRISAASITLIASLGMYIWAWMAVHGCDSRSRVQVLLSVTASTRQWLTEIPRGLVHGGHAVSLEVGGLSQLIA